MPSSRWARIILGEIAHLASLAEPTVGLVTNAGAAHLEGFGSPKASPPARARCSGAAESKASQSSMATTSTRRSGVNERAPTGS